MDFTLIAGPCALEVNETPLVIAEEVKRLGIEYGIPVIFKGSFDKANRTNLGAPRGPGIDAGREILAAVKKATGLRVTTDIHEPGQAALCAPVCDVLQIPAFLSRQTDLLTAAGKTGRIVNIKKGQWMSVGDASASAMKAEAAGAVAVWITERGNAFGYGDVVVDMRQLGEPRTPSYPVIFDATHSVKYPCDTFTIARAAVAAGCDGLFVETHPRPREAPSDGARMLSLSDLPRLVDEIMAIRHALNPVEV